MHLKESMQNKELLGTEREQRLEVTTASAQGSVFLLHFFFIGFLILVSLSELYSRALFFFFPSKFSFPLRLILENNFSPGTLNSFSLRLSLQGG